MASQKEIEVILMRQLASYLATPVFLVDPEGTLIFYNEPAEVILGRRFSEAGEMPAHELARLFTVVDEAGAPLTTEALPLVVALSDGRPACREFFIRGLDNVVRQIQVAAFPLVGLAGRRLGAVALFSETPSDGGTA